MSKHKREETTVAVDEFPDIELYGMRFRHVGKWVNPAANVRRFKDLTIGESFLYGGEEHIKTQDQKTIGTFCGMDISAPGYGIINNVCLTGTRAGQVSGMGPDVEVTPIAQDEKEQKRMSDTVANLRQLEQDTKRTQQRISTMLATLGQMGWGS